MRPAGPPWLRTHRRSPLGSRPGPPVVDPNALEDDLIWDMTGVPTSLCARLVRAAFRRYPRAPGAVLGGATGGRLTNVKWGAACSPVGLGRRRPHWDAMTGTSVNVTCPRAPPWCAATMVLDTDLQATVAGSHRAKTFDFWPLTLGFAPGTVPGHARKPTGHLDASHLNGQQSGWLKGEVLAVVLRWEVQTDWPRARTGSEFARYQRQGRA